MDLKDFEGKWCVIQTKFGTTMECHISGTNDEWVQFDEILIGYTEIPRIREARTIIESHMGMICLSDIHLIREGDRAMTEKYATQRNSQALLTPVSGGNKMPSRVIN